ncbi:MAG TPA: transketolase [Actinomycetota bacterium]|nr:transketolase [Actinomycetota bacterium]
MDDRIELWNDLAAQIAVDSIRATTAANSGHPTSSMSCAHLLAVLFADHLRTDVKDPKAPANDRFVLSKGHAAPALYAALKAIGALDDDQLLSLRTFGSPVEGHPAPLEAMPSVDVATGSLGQGLAIGVGLAIGMRMDGAPGTAWVVLGDSEMAEGSVWEAMEAGAYHGVANLVAIVDLNRLGQRGPTMHGWDADVFVRRAEAFGWNSTAIDGHDVVAIDAAYREARTNGRPTMIVARTQKGHGVSFLSDEEGWHGKPVPADREREAIDELGGIRDLRITPPTPEGFTPPEPSEPRGEPAPAYDDAIATRKAFGESLAWLVGERADVVVLDGEVGNSTHTEDARAVAPERFVQLYIAEQCMAGVAVGLQAYRKIPYAATFGAFWSRAYDQIRMGAISRADLRLCGSHAGVSIGEDGPSQMAVEDLAAFRAIDGTTVLYPADGNSTVALTTAMADLEGISYLRTTREATPRLYGPDESFPIGGSKRLADGDDVTLVGAGVTVHQCLDARERLAADGIAARVLDCYSVKPIDAAALRSALDTTGQVVVVEDHRVEGGLGDAVLDALASTGALHGRVVKLGVTEIPGSGTADEMRAWAGIDAAAIERAARDLVGGDTG